MECPVCRGNDADAPCAYATERLDGCLRVDRLRREEGQRRMELMDERIESFKEAMYRHYGII